ncbi:MAG: hypothetical protein ABSG41_22985 [Bryobacteraceae bacterium]|jgi:hypothetical protein
MKDGLKRKLEKALAKPIVSEEQVVYIMVELRKLMELSGDTDKFPSLLFHCDWVAHPVMNRKAAKKIVSLFDKHQEGIDFTVRAPGRKSATDMRYFAELGPIMTLSNFRNELAEYLRLQNLDATIPGGSKQDWANFLTYYAGVIEDCPLRCTTQGLKCVEEVILKVLDIKPGPPPYDFQLAIEWRWESKASGIKARTQQFY